MKAIQCTAFGSRPKLVELGQAGPGTLAEYMLVDSSRNLVPIEDVDPVRTPSLTDAALTPYQAIKSVLPRLVGGSTTVAIGAGGLGHVAIQRGQMRAVQLRADRPRRFTRVRPAGRTGYRRSLIGMTAHFAAMSVH